MGKHHTSMTICERAEIEVRNADGWSELAPKLKYYGLHSQHQTPARAWDLPILPPANEGHPGVVITLGTALAPSIL